MHNRLKKEIINKFNSPVNSAKDCSKLSETIYTVTERKISPTTLRRFYGLMPSKSLFSIYNLDTLAVYCGRTDYDDFLRKYGLKTNNNKIDFNLIEKEFNQITKYTLNSIAKRSLIDFNKTIPRKIINIKLDTFLKSDYPVFPIIAPGGYGKSTALAHWVKSLNTKDNFVLFCSASIFHQQFTAKLSLNQFIQLKITKDNEFLKSFSNKKSKFSKLILVIDTLDEITSDQDKLKSVTDYIIQVINNYTSFPFLKIIFSIKESCWNNVVATEFDKITKKQAFVLEKETSEKIHSNIPELTNSEIRKIFLNFNDPGESPLVYECIPWDIRELIRVPINLHYFSVLFEKKSSIDSISTNQLMREYLKVIIFQSKYAEQKEDIIWKVIDLMESEKNNFTIKKNLLKTFYPINLKRETGYYQAYNELISEGVFNEERIENKYGIFITYLSFKHNNIYYYLSALNKIKNNDGLDFKLLSTISQIKDKEEWSSNVISILYEIAYDAADYQTIENFCDLNEIILSSDPVRIAVGTCFRKKNVIREKLIQKFAASSNGQIYFFEHFVDINYLFNNYTFRISEYLKHKKDTQSQLFGNGILYLSGFLKLDIRKTKKCFLELDNIIPDESIHPWPIGRKVAYTILHKYFIEQKEIENLDNFIHSYSVIASSYVGNNNKALIEFELSIMISLVLIKEYSLLQKIIERAFIDFNQNITENINLNLLRNTQNSLPHLFLEYAKYKQGKALLFDVPTLWDNAINNYASTFDDFQYLILLNWFVCDYYNSIGKIDQALIYYSSALDLASLSEYNFYLAFLYKNDPEKSSDKKDQADEMISNSGFNPIFFAR